MNVWACNEEFCVLFCEVHSRESYKLKMTARIQDKKDFKICKGCRLNQNAF